MNLFSLVRFIVTHPLNRDAKLAAIFRFAKWQAASRILPVQFALPFVEETRLMVSRGMAGATGNYYCGLHEVSEMAFVLHALRPGNLFADVGANIGSYSILAAGAVGADVIAVEPVPFTFARLKENIRLNMVEEQVSAICCGLSDQAGELRFVTSLDTMNRVALPDEKDSTEIIPVRTLDEVCIARCPQIIKIDVEGHERAVVSGGHAVLRNPQLKAVIMETNESGAKYGTSNAELTVAMGNAGFEPCDYDPFSRRLSKQVSPRQNTIFVRNINEIGALCASSRRFKLLNGYI